MRRLCIFLLGFAASLFFLLTAGENALADYDVIVGTDLHYISPEISDNGELFMAVLEKGDGKFSQYAEEITEAFLADVIAHSPDALILTGDLTFNGAYESHRDVAEKLRTLEKEGIQVFVLPGNHDLYNRNAARFSGNTFERLPLFTREDFRRIYAEFGFDEAVSTDGDSLSYVAALNDDTSLLMLDFNTLHDPCGISEETIRWVEEQLLAARDQGRRVLAAGHQNLLQHHSMFRAGYIVSGSERLIALFEAYGADLFLSGHMHIQHIASKGEVTEIATSSLCFFPCQYGVLQEKDGKKAYHTERVRVSAWAEQNGVENGELLSFEAFAAGSIDRRSAVQAEEALKNRGFGDDEKQALVEYAVLVQRGVFSGDFTMVDEIDPNRVLTDTWRRTGTMQGYYLSASVPANEADHNIWKQP